MDYLIANAGLIATIVGATWALRSAMAGIERAVASHVVHDEHVHKAHEARIVKLEGRRRGGRS